MTTNGFNINFKLVPICQRCSSSIFIQEARWVVEKLCSSIPAPQNVKVENSNVTQHAKLAVALCDRLVDAIGCGSDSCVIDRVLEIVTEWRATASIGGRCAI
jgi:hypothetical protein